MLRSADGRNSAPTLVGPAVIVLTLILVFLVVSPAPAQPTIVWTPSSVDARLLAGESKTVVVSFVAAENFSSAVVRVVPELQPYLEVTPAVIEDVAHGETFSVNVRISVPANALPGKHEGTIQLRRAAGAQAGMLARPLPVSIGIEWPRITNTTGGYEVSVPAEFQVSGGAVGAESVEGNPTSPLINSMQFGGIVDGSPDGFTIQVFENGSALPPASWLDAVKPGLYYGDIAVRERVLEGRMALRIASRDALRVGYYVPLSGKMIAVEWGGYSGEDDSRLAIFETFVGTLRVFP